MAGFFRSIRAGLGRVAPEGVDEPRVVILTPGPLSETAFDQSHLASFLGYPLVEGRDLIVDNNRVWVRSLTGLDPVDVVVRRVDDVWCDPVELRDDSLLGVPGLLEVVRHGRVGLANPLGCAIGESPAIAGLLPDLAPHLLGEELVLRGPATWWCGDDTSRRHVLASLSELVLVGRVEGRWTRPVVGATLSHAELGDLRHRISRAPHDWVGHEVIEPSTTPTLTDHGSFAARPVVLRLFGVAEGADPDDGRTAFRVLPGGLARVAADPFARDVASGSNGTSKDTWITTGTPVLQESAWLPPGGTAKPSRGPTRSLPLAGRVAAELFVLGRCAEHAEVVIRLVRTLFERLDQPLGSEVEGGAESLRVLLTALASVSRLDAVPHADGVGMVRPPVTAVEGLHADDATPPGRAAERRTLELLLDAGVDGSLVSSLTSLVEAAYSVRDQLSRDTWPVIGDLEEEMERLRVHPPDDLAGLNASTLRLLHSLLALSGIANENLERDATWHFVDAGRRIERAQSLLRLIAAVLVNRRAAVVEDLLTESLLKASESSLIFRRRAGAVMDLGQALDLVVYDPENPRSLAYQLDRLAEHLALLERSATDRGPKAPTVTGLAVELELTSAERLAAVDPDRPVRGELVRLVATLERGLDDLLGAFGSTYFAGQRLAVLEGSPTSWTGAR